MLVAAVYILLSRSLILAFNRNPVIVDFGRRLLISQMALYPAFGLCYMMTITYQTIGASRYGLFLSVIRQGLFYVPFILTLLRFWGGDGHLLLPARRRYPDHHRVSAVHTVFEIHCLPKHGGGINSLCR